MCYLTASPNPPLKMKMILLALVLAVSIVGCDSAEPEMDATQAPTANLSSNCRWEMVDGENFYYRTINGTEYPISSYAYYGLPDCR